ncbi:hypothetical protein [Nocardia terpenica]|uniref:Uncharacterized protein n=1 Tax=Nocardia terpenica TaxID=455432 RepID=A0A6G9ZDX1_9NOCA|nr:hypothetical protein [Nocardia terpenica]QIS23547.1 hypothetical protein F6W96_39970 [Nocardia terpenica]
MSTTATTLRRTVRAASSRTRHLAGGVVIVFRPAAHADHDQAQRRGGSRPPHPSDGRRTSAETIVDADNLAAARAGAHRIAAVLAALALTAAGGLILAPPASAQTIQTLNTSSDPIARGADILVAWSLDNNADQHFVADVTAGGVEVDAGTLFFTATSGGEQEIVIPLTHLGTVTDGEQVQVTVSDTQDKAGTTTVLDEATITATLTCHPNPNRPGWNLCQ